MMPPLDRAKVGLWAVVMGVFSGIGKEFARQIVNFWDQRRVGVMQTGPAGIIGQAACC
ncbi:MAG TPA: hypothetical protein VFV38_33925 [Ktedonobacteraceae bacterium]|nr:hypothetical protein [Ktedonobacteraceae bacterium]